MASLLNQGDPIAPTFAVKPRHTRDRPVPAAPLKSARPQDGVSAGMPLFLQRMRVYPKLTLNPSSEVEEQEAERAAKDVRAVGATSTTELGLRPSVTGTIEEASLAGLIIRAGLRDTRGEGRPLPAATREATQQRFRTDFGRVRVHTDARASRLASVIGANAFTTGSNIYFSENRYDPTTPEGGRLLAHELAHVVQQGGTPSTPIQCDLMMGLPTALGGFEIEMATRGTPATPGMEGHIRFLPDPSGPYSTQIGLIQIANVTDVAGSTMTPGAPIDWTGTAEAGRMDLRTTGTGGAPAGWFVDTRSDLLARASSSRPEYLEPYGESVGDNEYGWRRSPTDLHPASIYDYPQWTVDSNFDFETVAKASDTQTVYGGLEWGFQVRSGIVQSEYAKAVDVESATFNEALERFRGYYTHEPIALYFDTDQDTPIAGEEAKIRDVLDYLNRYPDVMVRIEGYADERGSVAHNNELSLRRASSVQRLAVAMGVDPSRIEYAVGWGETTEFSASSAAGSAGVLRANRRVVMSFVRTATTPIVMP